MYALYIVGNVVEAELGRGRYVALFLVTGWFASTVAYWLTAPFELVPTSAGVVPIATLNAGASGAIYGLFGVFLAYNYRRRHLAFYAARMRSMAMVIALNVVFTFAIRGISWQAHLGGLVAGLVAGYALDGLGDKVSRTAALSIVLVGLVALSLLIIGIRTAQLTGAADPFGLSG
jgi:membrane associated rhomboid family serine protease